MVMGLSAQANGRTTSCKGKARRVVTGEIDCLMEQNTLRTRYPGAGYFSVNANVVVICEACILSEVLPTLYRRDVLVACCESRGIGRELHLVDTSTGSAGVRMFGRPHIQLRS